MYKHTVRLACGSRREEESALRNSSLHCVWAIELEIFILAWQSLPAFRASLKYPKMLALLPLLWPKNAPNLSRSPLSRLVTKIQARPVVPPSAYPASLTSPGSTFLTSQFQFAKRGFAIANTPFASSGALSIALLFEVVCLKKTKKRENLHPALFSCMLQGF